MRRRDRKPLCVAMIVVMLVSGCVNPMGANVSYLGHAELQHYKDVATSVEFSSQYEVPNASLASDAPRRIRHPKKEEIWDLSLNEAIQIGLRNNKIIRERDQFLSTRNPTISNPEQASTVYDPAVQETNVLFGQRGVEAALSDFDAQLTASMTWGRNEQISNNLFLSGGLPPGTTLVEETGAFRARLDKQFADSGQFSVINNWDYSQNNVPGRLFPSAYTGLVRAEYRRPLLSGAGTEFTRIFGPISRGNTTLAQGVVISRINEDISVADFESHVHQLIRDIQNAYWDLSLSYRNFDAQVVSWKGSIKIWRLTKAKSNEGLEGGSAQDEAQARDNLFDFQGRTQDALSNIYTTEGALRRMLGLSVNDGRIIRPKDEPTVAEFIPDWHIAVAEGITNRPEIRRQKWNIKSLDLQLRASRSLARPRLDFVSGYSVNGFGDVLAGGNDNDGVTRQGLHNALETITQGNQTGWNLGFEASMPVGFRAASVQQRNLEIRSTRARAALATQELEIAHEIRNAFQTLDRAYSVAQSAFNRRRAAEDRLRSNESAYEFRGGKADELVRAQQGVAIAEVAYYQSLIQYNQAITDFSYRTGMILADSNVVIGEDAWGPEASCDALRRAWARSHAIDNHCLHTEPEEFTAPARPSLENPPVPGLAGVSPTAPPFLQSPYGTSPSSPVPPAPADPLSHAPALTPAVPAPAPAGPRLPQAGRGFSPAAPSALPTMQARVAPKAAPTRTANAAIASKESAGWQKPVQRVDGASAVQPTIVQASAAAPSASVAGPSTDLPPVSDWDARSATQASIDAFAPPVRASRPSNSPKLPPLAPLSSFDDMPQPGADGFDMPLNPIKN